MVATLEGVHCIIILSKSGKGRHIHMCTSLARIFEKIQQFIITSHLYDMLTVRFQLGVTVIHVCVGTTFYS